MPISASERIVAELRARIDSGELAPGDLLPSARRISRDWHVAIATATRVHAGLREAGLAETLPGVGVVVRRPKPRATSRAPLRTQVVVATAIAIADTEGMDGVSMRRLAVELDLAPMSLYRYVSDKDDLRTKMLDAALAQWQPPERGDAGWRECLEAAGRGLWQLFRRHPWLAATLSLARPPIVPGGIGWTEWVLSALNGYELDLSTRFDIHLALFGLIHGMASNLETETAATAATGLNADEWMDEQLPALRAIVTEAGYPHLHRLVHTTYDFSLDRVVERSLRYFLDGLEVELEGAMARRSG